MPREVPAPIANAFSQRPTLPPSAICELLNMDIKTLRQHVKAGNIRYVHKGFGTIKQHREFTLDDVMGFLDKRTREECPSINRKTRRSTSTTFDGEVYDFMDRQTRRKDGRPKP